MKVTFRRVVLYSALLLVIASIAAVLYVRLSPQKRLARHVSRARIAMTNNQFGNALTDYEAALAIDPNSDIVLTELGNVRVAMEQPDRAVKYYDDCITKHPDYTPAWMGLMRARLALNQPDEVVNAGQRLLAGRRDAQTLVIYGDALANAGSYSDALKAYDEAVQLAPAKFDPVAHRAELFRKLQRADDMRQSRSPYSLKQGGETRPPA
jgi:tetratricopeptide (TPR) repeat protein